MSFALGRLGVWSSELRVCEAVEAKAAARELEALGYGAIWMPARGRGVFERAEEILAATERMIVATGILSIWSVGPAEVGVALRPLQDAYPDRFLLGLGVSHEPVVEREGGRYERPLEAMREYLDRLDAVAPSVARDRRLLAALGPRMLSLARDRSLGAHPYLVPPAHTRQAREELGLGPLLAPEQGIVIEVDARIARQTARTYLADRQHFRMANYVRSFRRLGFTDEDFRDGGSDRLVDAIIAWGDAERVAQRIRDHWTMGADHVCIQAVPQRGASIPLKEWRAIASVLLT